MATLSNVIDLLTKQGLFAEARAVARLQEIERAARKVDEEGFKRLSFNRSEPNWTPPGTKEEFGVDLPGTWSPVAFTMETAPIIELHRVFHPGWKGKGEK